MRRVIASVNSERQRRSILQPRVDRDSDLPWELGAAMYFNPEGVESANADDKRCNPYRVVLADGEFTQVDRIAINPGLED